jgi:hypothetical protein
MKIKLFTIAALVLFLIGINNNAKAEGMVYPGEELTYEVSFMGIKLGSIRMVIEGYQDLNGLKIVKGKSYIDSYDGIPFVDLKVTFESWMDTTITHSHKFVSNTKTSDGWYYEQTLFDYANKRIKIDGYQNKKLAKTDIIQTNKRWSDGLSLFYIARQFLYAKKNLKIPTLMDKDTVQTSINFMVKKEKVDIDAVSYPVRTVYFSGNANWTGIYGMTGAFEGWFSDDYACIPIKAKLKVYIGNVDVELKNWKRKGWGPPK